MSWFAEPLVEEFERMQREFDKAFGRPALPSPRGHMVARTPVCDMCETEDKVITQIELPGVDKKDIQLNVADGYLEVKVEKSAEKEDKKKDSYSYRSWARSFYRAIPLPTNVDGAKANAKYENGVLTIELPKAKRPLKQIEVK